MGWTSRSSPRNSVSRLQHFETGSRGAPTSVLLAVIAKPGGFKADQARRRALHGNTRAFQGRANRIPEIVFRSARLPNQFDRKAVQIAEA